MSEKLESRVLRVDVVTLFPGIIAGALGESIMGRAQKAGFLDLRLHQLRDYATDKHKITDDRPYGGGPGMVMKCEPVFAAVESILGPELPSTPRILLSPQGIPFSHETARRLASLPRFLLICGHYEGVDERVREHLATEELSIGDYVLTNGALAAAVVIDAVVRLIPGVLGDEGSPHDESHSGSGLEYPQYTRPPEFRGHTVPEILLSGHHGAVEAWRREQARARTLERRPDLARKFGIQP
ncbi:MAG TPA: tRNA (guanosine(37)-N1)-methyltransferase TrmD [Verrucomicrobiae bacterium]|nr:tRNA (guanosine(37)-N1)-methyltransferase TrmD [Verrucomicrobiae bacterium]